MVDETERRQIREACTQAMPFPGETQLRVSLFQWAREASPGRVLRLLNMIDQLCRRLDEHEIAKRQHDRADADHEDDVALRMALELEWDNCRSIATAFYRAVKDQPGVWTPKLRDVMRRAEEAGLHRFEGDR